MDKKNIIRFLVLWVGTSCTLRCRDCCNLIPYMPQISYDEEEIFENLDYITKEIKIDTLQIQGGEPFTHKNIGKIIEYCANNTQISKIEIASNGTILPDDDTICILKKYSEKVCIRFSDYDCTESRRKTIIERLEKRGVKTIEYDFVYGTGEWFDLGDLDTVKEIEREKIKATYQKCPNKSCWTLAKNFFAGCGRMISYLNLKDEKIIGNNIIDINELRLNNKSFVDAFQIFEKNYNEKESDLCGYCRMTGKLLPAAIQLESNK